MESRVRQALFVYGYTVAGIFLILAPWTPVWEQATESLLPRVLHPWILSGWVRGGVSAIGALDLGVALQIGTNSIGKS